MLLDSRKQLANPIEDVIARAGEVILGKEGQIRLAMACILARGHLLIEDVPGVGKTTLSHALARLLGLDYQRIQFTSDLLPADIIGVSIFDRDSSSFRFHPGPIFAQIILADEINRASPKAQSALLEAMEEHQVTAEGETRPLPEPFFVIATQNPMHQVGTFPLPESQLDRFLMCITLGYPDAKSERELLSGMDRREALARLQPVMTPLELVDLMSEVRRVHASEPLLDYLQALIAATRSGHWFVEGLSPRAGIGVLRLARARALIAQRDFVSPDDVQAILPQAIAHRLVPAPGAGRGRREQVRAMIESVPLP